jgi:amino acid adenylation domain-containing protein
MIRTHNPSSLIHDILDNTAARLPEKMAILHDDGTSTYGKLALQSYGLASWLYRIGVRRGDRIALMLPNSIPLVLAIMAASRLGAIFFVVNPATKPYLLEHMMEDAQPVVILTSRQSTQDFRSNDSAKILMLEEIWETAVHCNQELPPYTHISHDIACLIYTSGSTGKPKAIISSHENVTSAAWSIQESLRYQESDVVGNFLPLAFDVGLYQIMLTFLVGATLALGQESHVGPGFIKKLRDWHVTGLPAVPSLVAMLTRLSQRDGQELPPIRFVTNTGARLPSTTIDELHTLYPACLIYVMFGLTECKRVSILQPDDYDWKHDSVGTPLPDTECLIIDSSGSELPAGEAGELVVRGPTVMQGYWHAPEMTERRFRTWGPGQERVLFTGDTCMKDADGYLYFKGREDDIYKQGGYRVSALEIEAAVEDISEMHQAALLPPIPATGTVATLFVSGPLTLEELRSKLRERLEDYKVPPQIFIREKLTLTSNGKIDKKVLRQELQEEMLR